MTADFSRFTAEEFSAAFGYVVNELVKPLMLTPVEKPVAILLGGQSGAGKTYLHTIFRERLAKNVIVINGDEYRRMHPHYNELQETYGKDAVSHTAAWAGAMVEHLINALSKSSYNLIFFNKIQIQLFFNFSCNIFWFILKFICKLETRQ